MQQTKGKSKNRRERQKYNGRRQGQKAKAVPEHKAIQNVKQSKKAEAKDINLNTKFQKMYNAEAYKMWIIKADGKGSTRK